MKNLEMKDVLKSCGLPANPAKYEGLPVGEISAEKLKEMWEYIGKRNLIYAVNFAEMVKDLPSLEPEQFIEWCWRLDMNWWWDKKVFLRHYSAYYEKNLLDLAHDPKTSAIQEEFEKLIRG